MVGEGKINKKEAISQIDATSVPSLLAPVFEQKPKKQAIEEGCLVAKGLNAGPGAASGKIVFDSITASEWVSDGKDVILVRQETSPEDIMGMEHSQGILTARGGMTSHAAVVARGMNKPCIVGCSSLHIDHAEKCMFVEFQGKTINFNEGDEISIDGSSGEVIKGILPTQTSEIDQYLRSEGPAEKSDLVKNFLTLMSWADDVRYLKVRANADTPQDAQSARSYGAEGIGLCRTEHMFFEGERIAIMRQMILAENKADRQKALDKLLIYQEKDFQGIFEVMDALSVTIRLLDPPLHEFLPHTKEQIEELAKQLGISAKKIYQRIEFLREENPMLGHRGCRLGISFPEVTRMQTQAIIRAAISVKQQGKVVLPEIMVPLVGNPKEFLIQKEVIIEAASGIMKEKGEDIKYMVGTMIEVPRAAVLAGEIAEHAEFFSFGTNDLTQMVLAFSRDDSASFLEEYIKLGIYELSPFQSLDQEGVGELIKIAMERGKKARPQIKIGICGEHGGDPQSIQFFHEQSLQYVSCSPFRVPVARLAAAQAALS